MHTSQPIQIRQRGSDSTSWRLTGGSASRKVATRGEDNCGYGTMRSWWGYAADDPVGPWQGHPLAGATSLFLPPTGCSTGERLSVGVVATCGSWLESPRARAVPLRGWNVLTIRRYEAADAATVWALNRLPHLGATGDPSVPLQLEPLDSPPSQFPDLADIDSTFIAAGGDFFVADMGGHLVGMAGFRANEAGQAQVLRVRVHPAVRRHRLGARLMGVVERRAVELGFTEAFLDTSTHQPEAMAFYRSLGYQEVGRETRPDWDWTLVYFAKQL